MNKNEMVFQEMMMAVKNGLEYGKLDLERDMPQFKEEVVDEVASRLSRSIEIEVQARALSQLKQNVSEAEQQSKEYLVEMRRERAYLQRVHSNIQDRQDAFDESLKDQDQRLLDLKPASWISFTGYLICSLSAIVMAIFAFNFLWQLALGNVWAWFDPMHIELMSILKVIGFLIVTGILCFIGTAITMSPMFIWEKWKKKFNLN